MSIKVNKNKQKTQKVVYNQASTIADYAKQIGISPIEIIKTCLSFKIFANVNQVLDKDTLTIIFQELGYEVVEDKKEELIQFDEHVQADDPKDLVKRAPIVTVMGHVDHGKTTLLDTIRHSRVASGEAGGITQHIGAYSVVKNNQKITFIDTPGHAAFSEMRARGAKVTDIVVLVVAADDSVMPQTKEAIDHVKACGVKMIVAINKCDKPGVNPDNVLGDLAKYEVLTENWGGTVPVVQISALKNQGIDELLDMILLVADLEDLKANPKRLASGTVIEARVDKGRGNVATVIIDNGTLKVGDNAVVGNAYCKVRTIVDANAKSLKKAEPADAVEITGLQSSVKPGDKFICFENEKTAKQVATERANREKTQSLVSKPKSLEDLLSNEKKVLNLIIKSDVNGSIEAIRALLVNLKYEGLEVSVVRESVGQINETDVLLANTSGSILLAYNVRPSAQIRDLAKSKGVEIRTYNIIYQIEDDIKAALEGMLEPEYEEVVLGSAEVRELFKVKKDVIAGCFVVSGSITRDAKVRLLREGKVVYEGEIETLRRFKDDAKEVKTGFDCGIKIKDFSDIKLNDVIEASVLKEVERPQ